MRLLKKEQIKLTPFISERNIEAIVCCSSFLKELLSVYIDKK
jgi:hypothetical protein